MVVTKLLKEPTDGLMAYWLKYWYVTEWLVDFHWNTRCQIHNHKQIGIIYKTSSPFSWNITKRSISRQDNTKLIPAHWQSLITSQVFNSHSATTFIYFYVFLGMDDRTEKRIRAKEARRLAESIYERTRTVSKQV